MRCPWVNLNNPLYVEYHDKEWGKPVYDDRTLFEFLILEGAQAGLSWETILNKRVAYRKCFAGFNVQKVAKFDANWLAKALLNKGIVRNRLKLRSAILNANAFLAVQKEYGSFANYIWGFVGGKPKRHSFKSMRDYPAKTALSIAISKDLLKRGFKFVGPTIIYAYLQAIGIVNDHVIRCHYR